MACSICGGVSTDLGRGTCERCKRERPSTGFGQYNVPSEWTPDQVKDALIERARAMADRAGQLWDIRETGGDYLRDPVFRDLQSQQWTDEAILYALEHALSFPQRTATSGITDGWTVVLRLSDSNSDETYVIGREAGHLSPDSATGSAVIGKDPGDTVEWWTPRGIRYTATIVSATPPA